MGNTTSGDEIFLKKNILLLNQHWFREELREFGHRVLSAGMSNPNHDILIDKAGITIGEIFSLLPRDFNVDVLVYFDDSTVLWCDGIEELKIPKILYSLDTHHHNYWHMHFSATFDVVLVAQKNFLHLFTYFNPNTQWCPPWAIRAMPIECESIDRERDIDVGFVGNFDPVLNRDRVKFFDELRELVPVVAGPGEVTEIYPRSKIVINQNVRGDLNFRVFEALSAKALLITPHDAAGMLELFEDGKELVTYENNNAQEAAEKIRFYLENQALSEQIAEAGYNKLIKSHTNNRRAEQFHQLIMDTVVRDKPLNYLSSAIVYLTSYLVAKQLEKTWHHLMLEAAGRCLWRSAQCQEKCDEDYLASLKLFEHYAKEAGRAELFYELMPLIKSCYSKEELIQSLPDF